MGTDSTLRASGGAFSNATIAGEVSKTEAGLSRGHDYNAPDMKYWLMKCEPAAYTIEDLERDGSTSWEGVRNYQARNFLRDEMKVGDKVLFYASNADPSGVTGVAEISREAYPDLFAMQPQHKYYDPKARPDNPIWYMVDIRFVEKFPRIIPLDTLKEAPGLEEMVVTKKGSRLSIQPVTKREFDIVRKLGRKK
jgi:predicted RNA-binding protein with PUA-like domain